jgi:hypothetical protein
MNFASEFVFAQKQAKRGHTPAAPAAPSGSLGGAPPASSSSASLYSSALDDPDTNVISIKFDNLIDLTNSHTGDPIRCNNCDAILSNCSKIQDPNSLTHKRLWKCEFCNFENNLTIDENEIPKSEEVTFIIEPAPMSENSSAKKSSNESKYLIYCIDISGSMSVTTPVI